LREPECEALFTDAARTVKQQARGQGIGFEAFREAGFEVVVPVQVYERHVRNMARLMTTIAMAHRRLH
jgi:hypothetical protein